MDAFERMGIVCLVMSCFIGAYCFYALHDKFLMAILFTITTIPVFWMAGLNTMDFLTKPFSEKGIKGILSWLIVIVLAIVIYVIFFVGFRWMLQQLMVIRH